MSRHPAFTLSRGDAPSRLGTGEPLTMVEPGGQPAARRALGEQTVLAILSLEALQGMVAEHTPNDQMVVTLVDQSSRCPLRHVGGSSEKLPRSTQAERGCRSARRSSRKSPASAMISN